MSFLTKARSVISAMTHPARPAYTGHLLRRTRFDYRREVGDGLDSSVVTAPVMWLQRSLPEARLAVRRRKRGGAIEQLPAHELLALIQRPNAFYGDVALWAATVLSYCIAGNAYWMKVRNRAGRPVELWYVPHWMMEPKGPDDGSEFLTHYRYSPGGGAEAMRVPLDDVVHFRNGIDPRNLRQGISPMDGVIREIFSDLESSNFVASLLRNMGVPGVVISPKGGAMPTSDDVDATKSWFQEQFGGDRRGGPLVMGAPTDVQPYGFNPQQMNLSEARDVAEERVCACLGVPAAVVGFGAGLQQAKVGATMSELRKLAWHNGVMPLARSLVDELGRSLMPDFGDADSVELYWNTDEVLALQEDEDKQVERANKKLASGGMTVFEWREAVGLPADDSHRIYLRPFSVLEVPQGAAGRQADDTVPDAAPKMRGTKAAGSKGDDHDHGDLSEHPRANQEQMKRGAAFVGMLQRQERGLQKAFEKRLTDLFADIGKAAGAAVKPLLGDLPPVQQKAADDGYDEMVAAAMEKLDSPAWSAALEQEYRRHYLTVATAVADAAERASLGTGLPDPVARAIVASGGKRAGLIDLEEQTRQAIYDGLAEGRAEGEGVAALAKRIEAHVDGGPWSTPEIRATIIARTETKYAQNISTVERAKEAGVERFMVFDGRLGPGRSLDEHIARNGTIVDAAEAAEMSAAEHPNGTLSFAPYYEPQSPEDQ